MIDYDLSLSHLCKSIGPNQCYQNKKYTLTHTPIYAYCINLGHTHKYNHIRIRVTHLCIYITYTQDESIFGSSGRYQQWLMSSRQRGSSSCIQIHKQFITINNKVNTQYNTTKRINSFQMAAYFMHFAFYIFYSPTIASITPNFNAAH